LNNVARGPGMPGIVWDFDGTLIDSAPDLADSLNALLARYGLAPQPEGAVQRMIGRGVAKLVEAGFASAGETLLPTELESRASEFMAIYAKQPFRRSTLMEHALSAMDKLSSAGFGHALCTNKPYAITRQILEEMGETERFRAVIGGDSTAEKKPHPLPLQRCMQEAGFDHASTFMIGDSHTDSATAKAAGVPAILVTFGYSASPVTEFTSAAVIDSLADLPDVIARLRNLPR
jgi:phosphoglycolate phosphatase